MKKKVCGLIACILVTGLLTCPTYAATFPDVPQNAIYAEAVDYISDLGIMVGDDQGKFNPDKIVNRAEMATIICNLLGTNKNLLVDGTIFADVPATYWANKFIIKAFSLGAIAGLGNGKFGPTNEITYEQALTMIINAVGLGFEANTAGGYPDGYIETACSYGFTDWITAEKGDLLTRSQIAMILCNVYKN